MEEQLIESVCNYSKEDLMIIEELLTKNNENIELLLEKLDIIHNLQGIGNSVLYIIVFTLAGVGFIYLMYKFLKIFI